MIIKSWIYGNKDGFIRIKTKQKPSLITMPRSGTWIVNEWNGEEWVMPCFPEIVLETLNKFKFIGCLKEEKIC
jgi:hypothetical protein